MKRVLLSDLPSLPKRRPEAHKGDFGRVLLFAGSRTMSGAALLSARGALRGGAGLVYLATPASAATVIASQEPCLICCPCDESSEGLLTATAPDQVEDWTSSCDVIAAGPGMGQSPEVEQLLGSLFALGAPMVLDADALNCVAASDALRQQLRKEFVLTPHPGEFHRLSGGTTPREKNERIDAAGKLAVELQTTVLLKGSETVVHNGETFYVNSTGNPGMATAGAGDVLTGLIAAFIAQGSDPFSAAVWGCFVHGLAGDLAARQRGEMSLIASDIIEHLPVALRFI